MLPRIKDLRATARTEAFNSEGKVALRFYILKVEYKPNAPIFNELDTTGRVWLTTSVYVPSFPLTQDPPLKLYDNVAKDILEEFDADYELAKQQNDKESVEFDAQGIVPPESYINPLNRFSFKREYMVGLPHNESQFTIQSFHNDVINNDDLQFARRVIEECLQNLFNGSVLLRIRQPVMQNAQDPDEADDLYMEAQDRLYNLDYPERIPGSEIHL